ncbi:MAG: SDR family oxidoreductase [Polyangiales bacterium]
MAKPLTCSPELLAKDLSGRVIVVTGANSGIGLISANQLAKQGATVVYACRRVGEAEKAMAALKEEHPNVSVSARALDLGDLASVRAFAEGLLSEHDTLHGLLNNAGVMNTSADAKTKDGFEMQIGVNHLGHFLLTDLLLGALKKGAPSRVVNVSSCFHDKAQGREGKIVVEDLHFDNRKYDGWEAYAQSKLANVLHAKELAKRTQGSGVTAVSVHPGWVRTDLAKHTMPLFMQNYVLRPIFGLMGMIEPWQGAQTSLHALLADDVSEHSGAFFSQTGMYRDKACNKGGWPLTSPNPNAHDEAMAKALWEKSEELVGA